MKLRTSATLSLPLPSARSTVTAWVDPDEPDADSFAGGGGASLGIRRAYERLGIERRAESVAINHWPDALRMYAANHNRARVYCEDIVKVDPVAASGGKRYALAWFSPTCIYFSQAKGGPLDETATKVRGLAWLACSWAASVAKPRVLCLENVKQFMQWGPLHRTHNNGCSAEIAAARGKVTRAGKLVPKCLKGCSHLRPIKARRGTLFNAFVAKLERYYRFVSWRVLRACDYGAPTSRERFFLIASDEPVSWPAPTHGPGRAHTHRTAAECIDWSIPCPSIFDRKKPLVEKTLARIRTGIERFVFGAARPFIVPTSYGDKGGTDVRVSSVDEPARTIAGNRCGLAAVSPVVVRTAHGDVDASGKRRGRGSHGADVPLGTTTSGGTDYAIATPYLVHRSNGERVGQAPRTYSAERPLGTIVAQGEKHALALPVLVKNFSERDGGFAGGQRIDQPAGTITAKDHHALSAVTVTKLRGTSATHVAASSGSPTEPLDTISASGTHHALTACYLLRYNGTSTAQNANEPLSTIDTRDRFAVVQLELDTAITGRARRVASFLGYDAPIVLVIDGVEWVLVDIGFRMLTPRELFRCQGFPDTWIIDRGADGKPLTKTAQIKCVGNSVPPQLAEAVATAAIQAIRYEPEQRRAA